MWALNSYHISHVTQVMHNGGIECVDDAQMDHGASFQDGFEGGIEFIICWTFKNKTPHDYGLHYEFLL